MGGGLFRAKILQKNPEIIIVIVGVFMMALDTQPFLKGNEFWKNDLHRRN